MSTPNKTKTSRLGRGPYQRPSADILDDLTNPGTLDVSGTLDVADSSEPSVTAGVVGNVRTLGTAVTQGTTGSSGNKVTAGSRDHVKVARPLVEEMRDAVWFLSEHGRPRVLLGELLDEAVRTWLTAAKGEHNDGQGFPVRGRLR